MRDPSNERALEVIGFLAIVNDVDGRDSIDSDLALVKACAGYTSPASSSIASWLNMGNDGSSLPGK